MPIYGVECSCMGWKNRVIYVEAKDMESAIDLVKRYRWKQFKTQHDCPSTTKIESANRIIDGFISEKDIG